MCKRAGRARMHQQQSDRRSKIRNTNFCFLLLLLLLLLLALLALLVVVGCGGIRGREVVKEDDGLLPLRGCCRRKERWRKRTGWGALAAAVGVVEVVVEKRRRRRRGRRDGGVCRNLKRKNKKGVWEKEEQGLQSMSV
jgi:hypothetical protein